MGRGFCMARHRIFPREPFLSWWSIRTVGSTRKAIVARSKRGQYFVLPDNGLLTLVEQRDGIEAVREITNPDWMIGTQAVVDVSRARHFLTGRCARGAGR